MQPSLKTGERHDAPQPLIEILENMAPPALHAAAWATCLGKGWHFGHGSNEGAWFRFWKMDLENDPAFTAIWEHARPRCEALAGAPLRVIRQYANGHTYGLGGEPHVDDVNPGAYTLLYYPNPEWKDGWEGETVYYDESMEIATAVRPRPNRGAFFDSRILHNGRAPSRICPVLRVTVAYKLEIAGTRGKPVSAAQTTQQARPATVQASADVPRQADSATAEFRELGRDGEAGRLFYGRVEKAVIDRAVEVRLEKLGATVRLPGYRQGNIPREVLMERYGSQARVETLRQFGALLVERALSEGNVASACELIGGSEGGDMEVRIRATHLPDLPVPDFSAKVIERLGFADGEAPSQEDAAILRDYLKGQVLDLLDATYTFPLFPGLIDREMFRVAAAAEQQALLPEAGAEREATMTECRSIAERRLRLGLVMTELARRFGIGPVGMGIGSALEDDVVDHLLSQARIEERAVTADEWLALTE
jgi:SM-20-related protein